MKFNSKMLLILVIFSFSNGIYAAEPKKDKEFIVDFANVYSSVKKLVDEGIDVNSVRDKDLDTVLAQVVNIAIIAKHREESNQKYFDAIPEDQITLRYDFEMGIAEEKWRRSEAIKAIHLLLVHGADFNLTNNNGVTPFDIAKKNNDQEIIEIFNKKDKEYIIDEYNVYESVRKLVDKGIDVNLVTYRFDPDQPAASMLEVVVLIAIKSKNNLQKSTQNFINTPDDQVTSKYEYEQEIEGEKHRRPDAIQAIWLLLVKGADINIRDLFGCTPYTIAKNHCDKEIIEIFNKYKRSCKQKIEKHLIPVLANIVSEY